MAVLQSIRNLFVAPQEAEPEVVMPAPPTSYEIRLLTDANLREVLRLNIRCFQNGDSYTKHTFSYLLHEPQTLSYQAVTPTGEIVGFIFVMVNDNGAAHLTTIGVAPEHRRRGIAASLLTHAESMLCKKGSSTVMLEVRVSNVAAQTLYRQLGYSAVQRVRNYYNNGEDCFLMMKSLTPPERLYQI